MVENLKEEIGKHTESLYKQLTQIRLFKSLFGELRRLDGDELDLDVLLGLTDFFVDFEDKLSGTYNALQKLEYDLTKAESASA